MEKWKHGAAAAVICTLLAVSCFLFYCLGMSWTQGLKTYDNRITLLNLDEDARSYPEAVQMRVRNQEEETPFSYALWGSGGTRLLQNPDLGRYVEVEALVVEGCSDLLLSSSVILDGTLENSCLIGESVAQALFGTSDATGLSLTMDGRDYMILGMLADVKHGAVFCAEELDTAALDRMNIQVSDNVTLSLLEQQLKWKLGFTGIALDYRLINSLIGLAGFGLCVFLWVYLLRLMAAELKTFRCRKTQSFQPEPTYIKGLAARLACIFGVIAIAIIFLRFHAKIPEDLIPTKWSDFSFWERLIHDKSERISAWIKCEKRAPELLYLGKTARAAAGLTLSYLCYIVLRAIQFGRNSVRKTLD